MIPGQLLEPFRRLTIDTPQVTSISNGYTDIIDLSVINVIHNIFERIILLFNITRARLKKRALALHFIIKEKSLLSYLDFPLRFHLPKPFWTMMSTPGK